MFNFLDERLEEFKDLILSQTSKDTTLIFLGNGVAALLGVVISIIVARALGPHDWGIVAAVISGVAILSSLSDLGFGAGIFKFVSKSFYHHKIEEANKVLRLIFSIRAITAMLFFLVLIIFSPFISPLIFKIADFRLSVTAAVGLVAALLLDFQIATIEAKQNFKIAAFFIASSNFFRTLLLVILVWIDKLDIISVLVLYFGSTVLVVFLTNFFQPLSIGFSSNWRKLLKEIIPFSGWMGVNRGVNAFGSRLDIIFILQLLNPYQAGIYAAAKHLANGVPIILGSFATVLAPRYATFEGDSLKVFFKKTILLSLFICILIFMGIFAAFPVMSFFGPQYSSSINVFQWLLVAMIPYALSTPAVNFMIYSLQKPRIIATLSIVQLTFTVIGNLLLIPQFEVYAPILVLGIINTITLVVTYLYIITYKK